MGTVYPGQGNRDDIGGDEIFTVTNWTEDLALSGTEAGAANVAAVLATVIKVLQAKGILKGSTETT